MNRQGNPHHNGVYGRCFQVLARERIRRRICSDRDAARRDVFGGIGMLHNRESRVGWPDRLSPVDCVRRLAIRLVSVRESRDRSGHHAFPSIRKAKGKG